jgi:acetyl esterase/lipase
VDPDGSQGDLMDIYTPAGATAGEQFPTMVFVHGGGWEMGNAPSGQRLGLDGYGLPVAAGLLATDGFVVVAVDYRLAKPHTNPPGNRFPDQIIDIKCALRYLRVPAHAATYNVDRNHIFAMGASAGGHLVSLAGTAPASAGFDCQAGDSTDWCGQSSAVQAVVDEWGVSDFTDPTWGVHASQVIEQVFGHAPGADVPLLERASPVTYIAPGDPPFLIIQGDQDPLNTPTQAPELARRLTLAGVTNSLYQVHYAAHGGLEAGEQPGITQLVQTVTSFLEGRAGS